jgi:hypothetical protein
MFRLTPVKHNWLQINVSCGSGDLRLLEGPKVAHIFQRINKYKVTIEMSRWRQHTGVMQVGKSFFGNGAEPASASKRCIRPAFISFIQQKTGQRPYNDHTNRSHQKKRCQSTTKLVQTLEDWTGPCASPTAIIDSLV